MTRLDADEHGIAGAGLRRVVSRAAGGARRRARAHARRRALRCAVATVGGTPAYAAVDARATATAIRRARLAASRTAPAPRWRASRASAHDYGQVALVAKVWTRGRRTAGVAYERFTPDGPMALLPERDHYGLVWTMTPAAAERSACCCPTTRDSWPRSRGASARARRRLHARRATRATFPLALEFARPTVSRAASSDRQRRAGAASGRGAGLQPRPARRVGARAGDPRRAARRARRSPRCSPPTRRGGAPIARRASRSRTASSQLFGNDLPFVRWPRGLALALLDALPPAKRAFTRAMLFGVALNARSRLLRACRSRQACHLSRLRRVTTDAKSRV